MSEAQKPTCLAMVLCDAVHRDGGNGKFFIMGTFDRVTGKTEPIQAQFAIYCAMTEFVGRTGIQVRFVDSSADLSDDESWEVNLPPTPMEIVSDDPNRIVEAAMGVRISFPKAGLYLCQLVADGDSIVQRRIVVVTKKQE
ncbi:MAG: hypothetical protein WD069_06095 [Planctomycetales bacterium]